MSNVSQPDSVSVIETRQNISLFRATEPCKCQPTRLVTEDRLLQLDLESIGTSAKAPSEPLHHLLAVAQVLLFAGIESG